ncbi:MAG: methyltransferase, partial [Qipengyuania citrea]
TDIAFEAVDYGMVAGQGAEAVADALSYFQRIGPVARAAAALEAAPRATMLAKLEALLEAHHRDEQVSLPAACWIVTARAPG